ncbi:arginase family protein [Cellulomonas fimi]|uniref:Arginase/agmatinase/formiminoglutamase n=1 Tax=Cellulomonas fimi (strain ATCC 484 / DSM 20113 / JCM 1341 / CCUG 24087 / LMG 16345 / NBRC 15513 / NCIMB 8980 / NCTC 7547 / NRS-133) TaxID=590998 RepID=F4H1G6_CELFA|nr:arginase family protein [Cellulomonas fimi]AEE46265.1 Arginase/agmatinase/formiminoglutamase [Cellulomonas fimi ATCC 484]NNH06204.1 arginase family protein [Cellulomonas fimi]VEH32291.1 Arginase [Cellulomonas fimi]
MPTTAPLGLLGVPSSVAAHAPGLERGPAALRRAGLVATLRAAGRDVVDHGDTAVARWRHDPPGRTVPHDVHRVVEVLQEARAATRAVLDAGHVPVVVGGECTVTLAVLAAAVDAGRDLGLVYVDGGQDLHVPTGPADEPIADSTGVAHLLDLPGVHPALAGFGPRRPLLTADRLAFVGQSDDEEDVHGLVPSLRVRADAVTADPVAAAARALAVAGRDGYLVHLDVDVLDFFALPLADVPTYGRGLVPATLGTLLAALVRSEGFAGLVVTEANPDRDADGEHLALLVRLIADALTTGR